MYHFLSCRQLQGDRTVQATAVEKIIARICRETGKPFSLRNKPSLAHLGIVSPGHKDAAMKLNGSVTGLGTDGAIIAYDSTHTVPYRLPSDQADPNDAARFNLLCANSNEQVLKEAEFSKQQKYHLAFERGPNLAVKVDVRVLASTTHGRWNKQTNDFLRLCADTKLSNYSTSSAHDPSNGPGSTGAPKWVNQQQVRQKCNKCSRVVQEMGRPTRSGSSSKGQLWRNYFRYSEKYKCTKRTSTT